MNPVGRRIRYCVDVLRRLGMAKMRRKIIHLYNTSMQCVLSLKCDKNLIDSRSIRGDTISKWGKHSRCIISFVGLCYGLCEKRYEISFCFATLSQRKRYRNKENTIKKYTDINTYATLAIFLLF